MADLPDVLLLVGRLVYGLYFFMSGAMHFVKVKDMAGYAASKKVPLPKLAVGATGLLILVGGALVALGFYPHVGLLLIGIFLLGVTPVMHSFWLDKDAMQKMGNLVNFQKNWALFGAGLVMLALPEPWPLGLGGNLGWP